MHRSSPLAVIFELNDSATQPAVKWSDRAYVFQIFGSRLAFATGVRSRHTTSIAPGSTEERQRRTAVLTKPGTAPTAAGAALRIDEVYGEFRGMSEGVDDTPGSRRLVGSLCTRLQQDFTTPETGTPAPIGAGVCVW
jgi:hypothetical protein